MKKKSLICLSKFLKKRLFLVMLLFLGGGVYWIFSISCYYFTIPIELDAYWNIPLIEMEIANRKYKVELDLGTKFSTLSRSDLNELDKDSCGNFLSFDGQGNAYDDPIYQISKVKIHDFSLSKIKVREESSDFLTNSILSGDQNRLSYTGRMGREVFEGKNFLLDFSQSKIILCKKFKDLTKYGYKLKDFIKVPFVFDDRIGIYFQVETDTGRNFFLLDSGSSATLLRPFSGEGELATETCHNLPVWRTQKFILGDHDFGERKLYLVKISEVFGHINGMLGMDFLKQHAIYLDTEQSVAYIAKSSTAN